jgi:hypothetical protein
MVDAVHVTCVGAGQFRDRQAGAKADLKDLVGGCTPSSDTTQPLRCRLDGRWANTQPVTLPAAPWG